MLAAMASGRTPPAMAICKRVRFGGAVCGLKQLCIVVVSAEQLTAGRIMSC